MKKLVTVVLAGMVLCAAAGGLFAAGKEKKAGAPAAVDPASMQLTEKTVTGILVKGDDKKVGYTVTDSKGEVIANLPKAKRLTIDISSYVGKKVKIVGMAKGKSKEKGVVTFEGIKTIEDVNAKAADAAK
jgi:hypothetical protein